jgi:hypothetical protein
MVTRATSTKADQLDIAAESLEAVGKKPIGAVLNGYSGPAGSRYGYAYERSGAVELPRPAEPAWDK